MFPFGIIGYWMSKWTILYIYKYIYVNHVFAHYCIIKYYNQTYVIYKIGEVLFYIITKRLGFETMYI